MTEEKEVTIDWEEYVKSEVNALLNNLLPSCKEGGIVINYKKAIKENTEAGPVYSNDKVIGVELILDFNFIKEMDKPV